MRDIGNTVPIFIPATVGYYENFTRQYYPELSKDVNIKYLQKLIGNDELVNIVNKIMDTINQK